MSIGIARALNIEKEEQSVVFLLLAQSVFLGIFAGALDVGANALFLEAYSADRMPGAFMVSGGVGILFTTVYTFLQNRIRFKLFTILNLMIAVILTGLLRFGYYLYDEKWLAFVLLVMMGPVIIISMLGFWGTAGRYFTLREGKRLFGIIDTGSVVGMILAFYAVPVLVNFKFEVYDTLTIGFASLLIAMLLQAVVLARHDLLPAAKMAVKKKKRSGIFSVFRKRYTSMMALFVVLSVIAAFFIHYSFMWSTQANYPDSRELTGFLGAFFGTMMIFTVVIKSTLYGWLMKNYGLRVTLLISPVLLLVLTVIASAVGGFFGYTAEAASFTFFFLVIALSKLFNKSLKDSIESPSMKILYQSLDSSERFDIQAKIDGIVNEFTAFAAGVIMAGLLFLSFITVIHFSYILIGILVIWVILGYTLYRSYRKTLNDSLAEAKMQVASAQEPVAKHKAEFSDAPMIGEVISLDPYFYHYAPHDELVKLMGSKDHRKQEHAWKFLSGTIHTFSNEELKKLKKQLRDPELTRIAEEITARQNLNSDNLDKAFRSGDKNQVLGALIQTVNQQDTKQIPHIITLLRDRDLQVRAAAIETAGKLKARELGSYLVDYLGHHDLYAVTWSALVNMGEIILENLENAFHKAGAESKVQLRIVRAMTAIGGDKASDYLFQKISYHQRDIREAAIEALFSSEYRPDEMKVQKLHSAIYDAAYAGAVNIATETVVRDNNPENGLLETVMEEKVRTDNILFRLLGIAYDKSAIEHVQESLMDIEHGDSGFALELLNLIVDDQVFAYLEPYFEDINVAEKIRRLQNEMPVEMLPYDKLLTDIINRDSLYTGNYMRICAIDAISKLEDIDAGTFLAAQLFHPNPAISGAASVVLGEKAPSLYKNVTERLDVDSTHLGYGTLIRGTVSGKETIELVERLKKWELFRKLDREVIFRMTGHFLPGNLIDTGNSARVSVIRTGPDGLLADGLVILLTGYPDLSAWVKGLYESPGFELYQIDMKAFREFIFDQKELHTVCTKCFVKPENEAVLDIKVKRT
ncbi:MAG: hypothetical protein K9J30_13800 [Bacteroidales bacterium]|nr:hypothetical protein [Bacteroidales bacterium]